jgi:hypothetical protein
MYYFNNLGFGPSEIEIYDGNSFTRISLGYDIPKNG